MNTGDLRTLPRDVQERIYAANPRLRPKHDADVQLPMVPVDAYRSKLERRYAAHLDQLRLAGEICWWGYELIRVRVASGKRCCFYTPDFVVVTNTTRTEFHETKGRWRTADRLRVKIAAGVLPAHRVVGVTWDGKWCYEEFST